MKAIIPVAGYAIRLYPLTKDKPKALLKVSGKPILEHIIKKIEEITIDKIFIVTNDKFFPNFNEWSKKFSCSIPVKILNDYTTSNKNRLGQIGDITFALEKEKIDDDLLVIAGDNLFKFSLLDSYNLFKNKKTCVNALYDAKSLKVAREQGVVIIDKNNKFVNFQEKPEKPESTLTSLGIYFFPKEKVKLFYDYKKAGNDLDKMGYFMQWLIKKENVFGHIYKEKWFDVGIIKSLEQARKEFK